MRGARWGSARWQCARAIGARGGLLQRGPLPRGGDQCRDVQGPALSWVSQRAGEQSPFIWVERGAQRSKRALQRERATQLIQWWRALEGGSSMLESGGEALQGGSSMLESRSRHLSRWLRTSVCAIAQQGSAGGSEAGSPRGAAGRSGAQRAQWGAEGKKKAKVDTRISVSSSLMADVSDRDTRGDARGGAPGQTQLAGLSTQPSCCNFCFLGG